MPLSSQMAHALRDARTAKESGDQRAEEEAAQRRAELKIRETIQRVVDTAPPLRSDQRARLAGLILAGGAA